jgi:hypothetical protein
MNCFSYVFITVTKKKNWSSTHTARHIIVKLLKVKDKERVLLVAKEK